MEQEETTHVTENKQSAAERALKGKQSRWMLAVLSFTESSFLPLLIDPFLMIMILARPERWMRYVYIATGASVLGGLFGYLIGALFFDLIGARLIDLYGLHDQFERTVTLFDRNAFWVVLLGAFTPIPYKIIALVAGFSKINVLVFALASFVGRAARFLIIGYVTHRFGKHTLSIFTRHINIATTAVALVMVAYIVFVIVR